MRKRLVGDDVWDEFDGTMNARAILAGGGNFDENVLNDPQGTYRACTVRMFDPSSALWMIYWIDGRHPRPDPPVVGSFMSGRGVFVGNDVIDERKILIRFIWSEIAGNAARWEQAFSIDEGNMWETNWIMNFARQQA
ncbi:DUF1579 domain-containing protein [Sphingomonas sp.]|uniref:DUF1579 domain-containing protein n=1 Tax=Sphingomonas sp. TaxID=28214 RepID=UPI0025F36C71|nr:DUF1579 domain-containing protein [Sphingomonas sp.]